MLASITDSFRFFIISLALIASLAFVAWIKLQCFPIYVYCLCCDFPYFWFWYLELFPRTDRQCPVSRKLYRISASSTVANISGGGESRIRSTSSQASCEIFGAFTSNLFCRPQRGGCKKCTHSIWKRNCFYKSNRKRPPQCLPNQNKRNALKKCSYYSFTETNKDGGFQKPGYATRRITITSQEVKSS